MVSFRGDGRLQIVKTSHTYNERLILDLTSLRVFFNIEHGKNNDHALGDQVKFSGQNFTSLTVC